MKIDFDIVENRRETDSLKWDVKENELPMWVADMDFKTVPAVTEALQKRVNSGIYGYTAVPNEWFCSIIDWWKRRHSFTIEKSWLSFCTGVVPAISSIVKRLTNVGDYIVVQTPVYNIFFHSIENAGRHVFENQLSYENGGYQIDFDDLERKLSNPLTTMMILCNPHNPIGKIWNKTELERIGDLCKKYGVVVLSDEIHCDLTALNFQYTPFASVSENCRQNSVTCISASKAFNLAGLQSAAVFTPNENLRNKVVRGLNSDEIAEPNCFAIESTVAAFENGENWLDELRNYLFENIRFAESFLFHNLPKIRLTSQCATYLLWLDCSFVTNDAEELANFIRQKTGLYLSAGNQFRGNGQLFLRMNVACPRKLLQDGLQRLVAGIIAYRGESSTQGTPQKRLETAKKDLKQHKKT